MTHPHELYKTVDVECLCCRSVQPIYFWSPNQPVVCRACERHQGHAVDKIKQRDKDHVGLWSSTLKLMAEDHAEELRAVRVKLAAREEQLRTQTVLIEDLRKEVMAGLSDAPEATVQAWFDGLRVQKAHEEVRQAYRSRGHAFRALWNVAEAHHAADSSAKSCSCGKKADQCAMFKAMDPVMPSLDHWEEKQVDLLRRDLTHELPYEHPDVQLRQPWRRPG